MSEGTTDLLERSLVASRDNILMVNNEYEAGRRSPRRKSLSTNKMESESSRKGKEEIIAALNNNQIEQPEETAIDNNEKWQEECVLALVPYFGPDGEIKETAVMLRPDDQKRKTANAST